MTDDLGAHDVEELRALMRQHHLLPEVPAALVTPGATARGASAPVDRSAPGSDASEALLAGILATPRPTTASTDTDAPEAGTLGTSQPADGGPGAARRRQRVRRRATALAVAAAAVVVAVVGSQLSSTPTAVAGGAPSLTYTEGAPEAAWDGSLPSAHDTLVELATVADQAPDLPRTGDVQHISRYSWLSESTGDGETTTTTVYPTADELWVGPDGSARTLQRRAAAVRYDGQVDTGAPDSAAGPLSGDDFFPGTMDPSVAAELPTDPDGMESALFAHMPQEYAENPDYHDTVLVESAVDLARTYIVPQDVASAMWTVLSDAPTIQLLGDTTDRLGRPGVAVAIPDSLWKESGVEAVTVLIISPTDGQLLGTETVMLTNPMLDVEEPTVTGFTTVTSRRWVAKIGD